MKLNVLKEHIRSLRKVLKSKLNGGNWVRGVNTWAVSLLRYSAALEKKEEEVWYPLRVVLSYCWIRDLEVYIHGS